MTNIAIIGLGKLGSAMAAVYASSGHKVVGVDIDDGLIERLQSGTFRTDEPEVNDLLAQYTDRLTFTRLPAEAVHASEIVFVVVPTPSKADGTFDSSLVVTACQQIGAALYEKKAYTLVVVVSTLMPGQMDSDIVPALERTSGKRAGVDFGVCYSPEFIALGRVVAGLRNPDYVLIGEYDTASSHLLRSFYWTIVPVNAICMSFVNAELAKLATNAYLSLKIAYANVLGQICENIPGANVDVVTQAVGSDHRIGMAYLRAGLPAGGVCLPRDVAALRTCALRGAGNDNDAPAPKLFEQIQNFNSDFFQQVMSRIYRYAPFHAHVAVLGTAYSESSSLETDSWGYRIADALRHGGLTVGTSVRDEEAQQLVDNANIVVLALPFAGCRTLHFHEGQVIHDLWRILNPMTIPDTVSLWQGGVWPRETTHV